MITIRTARETDADKITTAEQQIAAAPGLLVPRPHEYNVSDIRSKISQLSSMEGGFYVVAESENEIVGHALLEPMGLEAIRHIARLSIAVHPGHQAKGIGDALLLNLMERAKNTSTSGRKLEKIELNVRATNARAIRLYQRHGFQIEGRLVRRIKCEDGSYIDDLVMGLWL